ncbi:MAG: LacI family DNA-binding transcriptional regulator [Nostocoides sp.]
MGDVSIYDVARAAGVHASTVSRTFSNPQAVSAATRRRVLKVAAELGYRVNPLGQALRRGASTLVPLIVPDITNPFYGELADAVAAAAGPRGYQVVLCVTQGSEAQTTAFLASMHSLLSPFAIIAPSTRLDPVSLGTVGLAKRIVVIDRLPENLDLPTVVIDNALGVRLAFEHLYALGHRRIVFLSGTVGTFSGQARRAAFHDLAEAHGIEPTILLGGYGSAAGRSAADQFLAMDPRPTAVMSSNDMAAYGFMSAVWSSGLRIPEDLSVVGFDGLAIGETFVPPITTIAQPVIELGERAVLLAERLLATEEIGHEELMPTLLTRASTAPPQAGS